MLRPEYWVLITLYRKHHPLHVDYFVEKVALRKPDTVIVMMTYSISDY